MERKKLLKLNPKEYEHDFDRKALSTLENTPGIKHFGKKLMKNNWERQYRLIHTGSNIKVTSNHFPDIYEIFEEACTNLFINNIPDLYIENGIEIGAHTIGVERPLITLSAGSVEYLSPEELLFVIGHEAGHIKSGHTVYHNMARIITDVGTALSDFAFGIGDAIQHKLFGSIQHWSRMSEFSADRAGLLACQDTDVAVKVFMKLGGVPPRLYDKMDEKEFIEQAEEFKSFDLDYNDKQMKETLNFGQSHPWTVMRASELLNWVNSGEYEKLIEYHGKENVEDLQMRCIKCGHELNGNETFCGVCGTKAAYYNR